MVLNRLLSAILSPVGRLLIRELRESAAGKQLQGKIQQHTQQSINKFTQSQQYYSIRHWLSVTHKLPGQFITEIKKDISKK